MTNILLQQEHFQKYYDFVMPYLKTILVNANDESNQMLQSKVLLCISNVALAAGKEKFRDDLKQVVSKLYSMLLFACACDVLVLWDKLIYSSGIYTMAQRFIMVYW